MFATIQTAVCNHFGIELSALVSKDRSKSLAFARQLAVYLCRTILGMSYPELGRAFGGRDHTTCMSACRRIERICAADARAAAHRDAIVKALTPEPIRQHAPAPDYRIWSDEVKP